jgi:hypothetical protein
LFLGIAKEAKAAQASFYVLPESGEYEVGKRFSVSVFIDSDGAAINASQAVIYFPADKLKVVEISKAGSIFTPLARRSSFFPTPKVKLLLPAVCQARVIPERKKNLYNYFSGKGSRRSKSLF